MTDDLSRRVAASLARDRGRTPQNPWGKSGWIWERVRPDQLIDGTYPPDVLAKNKEWMETPCRLGGDSAAGGPATKLEIWRNAHWFVHLHRDELVLCMAPENSGPKDYDMPPMIWLSMRRTDRSNATFHDWREMQRVKNDLVGPEHDACELYPAERRLVDTADQFHLWCFEEEGITFPFGYPNREVADDPETKHGTQRPRT